MKKIIFFTFILSLFIISGCAKNNNETVAPENNNEQTLLGSDRDEHDCIGSAGYSWCESKQKCIRTWEEECKMETIDTAENKNWIVYKNEKFKFELKLPGNWSGYNIVESDYPVFSSVAFSFNKEHQPFSIFSIIKYSKEQWNDSKNPLLRVLDQSGEAILVCDGCCDEGGDTTGGGQFDEFQIERCKEVPQIIKTFKITQ